MSQCNKVGYGSKREARRSIMHMHETVRVYFCKEHRAYHTTQERYGKVAGNSRAWNAKAAKRRFNNRGR